MTVAERRMNVIVPVFSRVGQLDFFLQFDFGEFGELLS
jgi:hypothetical protein